MNASRLRGVVELLLKVEKNFLIQRQLEMVRDELAQLANQPQQPSYQASYSNAITNLTNTSERVRLEFTPATHTLIEEIGAKPYFIDDIPAEIKRLVAENPASPAVAHQQVAQLADQRRTYVEQITQIAHNLAVLGIQLHDLEEGEAEIGFLLPRDLFDNRLDKLIGELRAINRIIRAFSEVATGTAEEVEVKQISTSDPLFFFGINALTIAAIGGAISWALKTWKDVEEIRKIRAETAKLQAFSKAEIEGFFGSKIDEAISAALESQTQSIIASLEHRAGRKHEQEADIKWALEAILARVERGMTVEIRLLPPTSDLAASGEQPADAKAFEDIQQIIPQMVFPKMEGTPILKLSMEAPKDDKKSK